MRDRTKSSNSQSYQLMSGQWKKPVVIKCVTNCTGFVKLCLLIHLYAFVRDLSNLIHKLKVNPINTVEIQNKTLINFRRGSKHLLLTVKYCILDIDILDSYPVSGTVSKLLWCGV